MNCCNVSQVNNYKLNFRVFPSAEKETEVIGNSVASYSEENEINKSSAAADLSSENAYNTVKDTIEYDTIKDDSGYHPSTSDVYAIINHEEVYNIAN